MKWIEARLSLDAGRLPEGRSGRWSLEARDAATPDPAAKVRRPAADVNMLTDEEAVFQTNGIFV